jgi:hypothetical protein
VKDAFAKKFFGAGRDSARGALASVLRKLLKAGHLMRVSGTVRGLALQGGQGLAAAASFSHLTANREKYREFCGNRPLHFNFDAQLASENQ